MTTKQREITLRFLAQPSDQAGYACAVGWSGHYCVTIFVGGIRFYKPVLVGSLVEVQARLIYTGRTSMHVAVDVRAGDLKNQAFSRTTHCVIVFVSVDDHGSPTAVTPWGPETAEQKADQEYALKLMGLRKSIEAVADAADI